MLNNIKKILLKIQFMQINLTAINVNLIKIIIKIKIADQKNLLLMLKNKAFYQ